jgi:ABC-type phosphate/phosphonate transport system substrate-binding protein
MTGEKQRLLRRLGTLLLAMALTGLAVGCGGGNSTTEATSASSAPLTKQEFVKRADATCLKNLEEKDAALQKAFSEQQGVPSKKELEALAVEVVIPAYANLVEELGQLSPPSDDTAAVEGMVADYERGLKQVEEDPRQLISSEPFKETNEAARQYGLETCSL